MKKTLLMATLLLAALTFSSDLCAQRQGRTPRSRVATTTASSSKAKKERVLVRSTTSSQIPTSSAKPMERAMAKQGKTRGRSTTTTPMSSSQKRKVTTVKRK